MRNKIYDINNLLGGKIRLPSWLALGAEKLLGLHLLNVVHDRIEQDWEKGSTKNFFDLGCKHFNLLYDLNEHALEYIPKEGPCVIVANHPHGFSDGIMLGDVALKVRSDVHIVVNEFLAAIVGMRPYTITVDVYGGDAAKRANMAAMRELLKCLRAGHCVLVFPSGSVSTYSHEDKKVIEDPWQTNIIALIRKTQAQVVPLHISGRTGLFFQFLSLLHKPSRGTFLPREIHRDGRMRHRITIAPTITPTMLSTFSSDVELTDYLRLRTLLLGYSAHTSTPSPSVASAQHARPMADLAPDVAPEKLSKELASLPAEALYYEGSKTGLQVYVAQAAQIPHIMRQITIERERTFRAVREGTGEALDKDSYDDHYHHLFMWDSQRQRLAGAYRMGCTDLIIQQHGIKGLYNSQFFDFDPQLRPILAQGLEMGRAFLCEEYQGHPASLDTLWMGIGRYTLRHPQYRYLYGTVSIASTYTTCSRALMHSYLRAQEMQPDYAPLVRASFPPPREMRLTPSEERLIPSALPNTKRLSKLVSEIEANEAGIPVLLKHYLRLAGKMLSFGIDESFGNTLDCFVLVDLEKTPARILRRYQGLSSSES